MDFFSVGEEKGAKADSFAPIFWRVDEKKIFLCLISIQVWWDNDSDRGVDGDIWLFAPSNIWLFGPR